MIFARALKRIAGGYQQIGSAERIAGHAGIGRSPVNDQAYAILPTDVYVALTALTAARTLTLPAAAAYPPGQPLDIGDESGKVSATFTVGLTPSGSDTINTAAASLVFSVPFFRARLFSDGVSNWSTGEVSVAGGGTGTGTAGGGALDNVLGIAGQAGAGLLQRTAAAAYAFVSTLGINLGGTGATTAAGARGNLGAAASGANTDLTSVALSSMTCAGKATFGSATAGSAELNVQTTSSNGLGGAWGAGMMTVGPNTAPSGNNSGALGFAYDPIGKIAYIGSISPALSWDTIVLQFGACRLYNAGAGVYSLNIDATGAVTLPSGLVVTGSASLGGSATATTPAAGDASTKLATTLYADRAAAQAAAYLLCTSM